MTRFPMLFLLMACATSGSPKTADDSATIGTDDSGGDDSGGTTGVVACEEHALGDDVFTTITEGWSIVFNEVYAAPQTAGGGDEDDDFATDWLELYNLSSDEVSLVGVTLSDSGTNDDLTRFFSIAGHERLFVYADGGKTGSSVGFRLNDAGEKLALKVVAKGKDVIMASVSYPEVPQNCSVSRESDGADAWMASAPTQDAPN